MERQFKRERGFFTLAQNSVTTDYVRLAYALALSLKATQHEVPYLAIGITPDTHVSERFRWAFDEVIEIPWGDAAKDSTWKLQNEWKAFYMTPYEKTIKLDADMLFPSCIDPWWPLLEVADIWPAMNCLTYRGEVAIGDHYRKTFTRNELPNVYTAFMYFDQSEAAKEVFELVKDIFDNWRYYAVKHLGETIEFPLSTDVAFALAFQLLDVNTIESSFPSFVHMKSQMQNWEPDASENWLEHIDAHLTNPVASGDRACHGEAATSDLILKFGAFRQVAPVHYHIKEFMTDDIIETYERHLGRA